MLIKRMYILLIAFIGAELMALSSPQRVYIDNASDRQIDIYVDKVNPLTIDPHKGQAFSGRFETLSYKDRSGQLTPIVNAHDLVWRQDDDLYVTFTFERPSKLHSRVWNMKTEWKNRSKENFEWSKWGTIPSYSPEEAGQLAKDPTSDPKALRDLKDFLRNKAPFAPTRDNREKYLRTTYPRLTREQIEEILDTV